MQTKKFFNRDGFNVSVIFIEENKAILETDAPTMRMGAGVENTTINVDSFEMYFDYIDPTGGPMISLGDKINDKTITKIYSKSNKIYFEFNENN